VNASAGAAISGGIIGGGEAAAAGLVFRPETGLETAILGARAMAPQVIAEKRPLGDRMRGNCRRVTHFPLPIIILAQDARANRTRRPRAALVASAQQRARGTKASGALPCQCFRPFGTMGRNFSQNVEKVPMAGAKGCFLANFFR
jgi:hypothetical protein